jgi:hypothetical protein
MTAIPSVSPNAGALRKSHRKAKPGRRSRSRSMVVSGTDSRNVETLSAPVGGSGGRLPSLLGREFFRTRVTSYHAGTFEDAVIFVHDVASGLAQLGGFENKLIASHSRTTRKVKQRVCWAAGGVRWGGAFWKPLTG